MFIALGMSIFSIILIFLNWITIPFLGYFSVFGAKGGYSLFELMIEGIKVIDDTDAGGAIVILVVLLLLILMIIGYIIFIIKLLSNYVKSVGIGLFAFIISLILSVAFCIIVPIINSSIDDNTWGLAQNVLRIGAGAILMLINSLAGIILVAAGLKSKIKRIHYQRHYYM